MAVNEFTSFGPGLDSPATNADAVIPADGADLGFVSRALYIGGGGDVRATMLGGQVVTFKALAAGSILPVRVARVMATGTTATHIVGLR